MRERDAFRTGFHFTMGAIIALVIACCLLVLIIVLFGFVVSVG